MSLAGSNPALSVSIVCVRLLIGSCAAEACEPRQGREEATVSRAFWVPQGCLVSSLTHTIDET